MSRRRSSTAGWTRLFQRSLKAALAPAVRASRGATQRAIAAGVRRLRPPAGAGLWLPGVAIGPQGARAYRLFRPSALPGGGERVPLLVMLHGCGQDAKAFASSTRMNTLAASKGFIVLYPEQDRLANLQGCWNWFETDSGRAYGEAQLILKAIDMACALSPVDRERVVLVGFSAGASMAALLATRHPERFSAVVMHSGIPPGTAHSSVSAMGAMRGRRTPSAAMVQAAWPPLLVVHGAADGVVSPRNGVAAAHLWAEAGGAVARSSRQLQRGKRHAMTVTDYRRGAHLVAQQVAVDRLGHAWSGGAAGQAFSDSLGPDASRLAWAFAAKAWTTRLPKP
ncbi:extracellular catalytic domain type 1 short-chain-length polyhydroxyalkanoate depolymerase [Hydrogenophaga sp. OTU3427]|uniref:extracellular catalytic domain type 1 short-chain-length polyhydroxyalkanoate depolymerase n=1 Tax=Hydrogenophaga sp. OTU3427 TaxID=3043856 RepID=UPI00313ECB38